MVGKLSSLLAFLLNTIKQVSFFPKPFAAALSGVSGVCRVLKVPAL